MVKEIVRSFGKRDTWKNKSTEELQSQVEQELARKFNEIVAWKNGNAEQWQRYVQLGQEQMTSQREAKKALNEKRAVLQRKPEGII